MKKMFFAGALLLWLFAGKAAACGTYPCWEMGNVYSSLAWVDIKPFINYSGGTYAGAAGEGVAFFSLKADLNKRFCFKVKDTPLSKGMFAWLLAAQASGAEFQVYVTSQLGTSGIYEVTDLEQKR